MKTNRSCNAKLLTHVAPSIVLFKFPPVLTVFAVNSPFKALFRQFVPLAAVCAPHCISRAHAQMCYTMFECAKNTLLCL